MGERLLSHRNLDQLTICNYRKFIRGQDWVGVDRATFGMWEQSLSPLGYGGHARHSLFSEGIYVAKFCHYTHLSATTVPRWERDSHCPLCVYMLSTVPRWEPGVSHCPHCAYNYGATLGPEPHCPHCEDSSSLTSHHEGDFVNETTKCGQIVN